ncbi:AI-2E family transporter [Kiritimatiellaeota bacterium B1221]|nr:AI-2E family transporter [Kiritimatiellaeota bacterium B1221]
MTNTNPCWPRERILKISLLSTLALGTAVIVICLSEIFIPVGIAMLIAYILNPVIAFMDRHHSRRVFTVSLVYVIFLVMLLGSGIFLGPALVDQGQNLVQFVKEKSREYEFSDQLWGANPAQNPPPKTQSWWAGVFGNDPKPTNPKHSDSQNTDPETAKVSTSENSPALPGATETSPTVDSIFKRYGTFIKNRIPSLAIGSAKALFNGAGTVANFLLQFLLTLFYAFFFMLHFPKIRDTLASWIPHSQNEGPQQLFRDMDDVVAGFFRGRLLVCFISAFVMSIGLLISGIPYWLLIGIAAGFLGIIPFIGVVVTLIPSLLIASTSEHMVFSLIGVLVTFGVVQGIVEPFVGPFVISQKVSLHPVTIVIVLMVGAALFGVLGLFLAIPLFGILKLLTQRYLAPSLQTVIND